MKRIIVPKVSKAEQTTAHNHISRFYSDVLRRNRFDRPIADWIRTAPSEFSVEMAMREAVRLAAGADRKTVRTWVHAARARVLMLRGHLV